MVLKVGLDFLVDVPKDDLWLELECQKMVSSETPGYSPLYQEQGAQRKRTKQPVLMPENVGQQYTTYQAE